MGEIKVAPAVRIVTFPEDDDEFAADVERALEGARHAADVAHKVVADLIVRLRPTYPRLALRQQDALASFDLDPSTWYAYRDGYDLRNADAIGAPARPRLSEA